MTFVPDAIGVLLESFGREIGFRRGVRQGLGPGLLRGRGVLLTLGKRRYGRMIRADCGRGGSRPDVPPDGPAGRGLGNS